MTLSSVAKQLEKYAADNSPQILTGIGVAGTITTAFLTGKATFKAAELLEYEYNAGRFLDKKEKGLLVWKLYVPPVVAGALTVTSIITANRIGNRRAAAMAAAYAVSERMFDEYKSKVVEKLGERKEQTVRDEVAQDRLNRNPVSETHVFQGSGGDVLCYEPFTGRYFKSDMEAMKKAQNDTNYAVLNNFYASLTDFYNHLGLDRTDMSDEFGWNSDDLLELTFTTGMSDDARPCLVMNYKVTPIRGYSRVQ